MRRVLALLVVAAAALCASLGAGVLASRTVLAQDTATADEIARRVEWLRDLPPEQRAKLKAALDRFRDLPEAKREKLRTRAAKLGPDRLDGLAGRDIGALRKRRSTLDAELDQVMSLLGAETLAKLTEDERAYIRSEALRGLQRHIQRRLLNFQSYDEWEKLTPQDRRARLQDALTRVVSDRMSRLPDEERARILMLPPKGQAAERARLLAEYRMDQTIEFSRIFDRHRLQEFLARPEAERLERVKRWKERSRWHALARVLREDLGIAGDVRRDLAALGPAAWARVMVEFNQTEGTPLAQRKMRIEQLIRKLAGERALDPSAREPRVAPFVRTLRERRLMNSGPPPGTRGQSREIPESLGNFRPPRTT